jgi:hypothetical protein
MHTAYVIVTLVGAAMAAFSAVAVFVRAKWVMQPLAQYRVPQAWLPWLGTAKSAGAVGLVVGLFVPVIGPLAAIGLVLYFLGAVITVLRARVYTHIPYPMLYLAPAAASLALWAAG